MPITAKGKSTLVRLGVLIAIIGGFVGLRYANAHGYGKKYLPSFMVSKISLDDRGENSAMTTNSAVAFASLPSRNAANLAGAPEIRINFWAWNSQMGCLYSNGGPVTTEGSLMAKQGVHVSIERQDDNNQMMAQLTALAKGMDGGKNPDPKEGVHFVGIMGDGSGAFLAALNKELIAALGKDFRAEIVGSCGYSRGEDKLYGPKEWKENPQSLKGAVIAGVVRDGDWNIAMRYAADNNVPNNPDETTYDANAMNWVNTSSYTDAAQKAVAGYCEDRKVINNGKPTGETKHICVQGAVTWTPGDVTMAHSKGGFTTVISTKQYQNQMPHVIIGIHKWDQMHAQAVEKMLTAFMQGGDQVLTYPKALDRAAEISQEIYKESGANADYWEKYYKGTVETDKTGNATDLGGSKANNLADNLLLFGLANGSSPQTSRFHATYTVFGDLVTKMYPKLVPNYPPMDDILDLSYLKNVAQNQTTNVGKAEEVIYTAKDTLSHVIGHRALSIEFVTGSDELTPLGQAKLQKLSNELSISALNIQVNGYTDNTGSAAINTKLSEDRAYAVKRFLENYDASTFPTGRIRAKGYGPASPVADNNSDVGRSKNRRVEILIGQ